MVGGKMENVNVKQLLWMFLFVILVACFNEADKPKKSEPDTHISSSRAILGKIEQILLDGDRRSEFCSKVEVQMDDDRPEQINCDRAGMIITYSFIAERSLTITLPDGDVMSDIGLDGEIDFGIRSDRSKEYYNREQPQYLVGKEHKDFWQQKFIMLLNQIEKDLDPQSSRSFVLQNHLRSLTIYPSHTSEVAL